MSEKIKKFTKEFLKKLPDIKVGDTVKVHQKIKEGDKERIQVFEGVVLSIKHGRDIQGTITVRRIIAGIGVEKTFPFHSPVVEKIEIVSRGKARRAKLYYLRERVGKKAKLKRKEYIPGEETIQEPTEKPVEEQPTDAEQTESASAEATTDNQESKQENPSPEPQTPQIKEEEIKE